MEGNLSTAKTLRRLAHPFRDWKIRTRLISITLFLVLLPLLAVAFLSTKRFNDALREAAEQDLEHLVRSIYSMCMAQQEMVQQKVSADLKVARYVLQRYGPSIEVMEGERVRFDAINQVTHEVEPVEVPVWRVGGIPLQRDTCIVDEVQLLVGGTCTIFQFIGGDRLLRISTNVTGKDGRRAVGTFIPRESPVTEAILAAKSYTGRAFVVDDWYIAAYEPLLDGRGVVIGALYVGVREQSATSLKKEIKGIKVGKTGYVYTIDSSGTLRVHPAKEGDNILDSRDTSGFEYIRAMIEDAMRLGQEQVGTIRYPWMNPELGETKPRQKITKYIYFRPWDWIIAAGTYEEEIYQSLYETERFIIIVVVVSTAMVFGLTIGLSNVLTRPVLELTRATTRMLDGDLSQRVHIKGDDEFGILGYSFNRMAAQIQDYTANLQRMVDERTRELQESRERYRDLSRFLNSILESATEYAIMALDFYGKIIEFNTGAERVFGWKKEEVLGKENIGVTILPEDRSRGIQEEISRRTRTEGLCELELERIRKDGSTFPAHSVVTAIQDPSGKVTGFVEIVRDLTQRKALERELRETKEFLENVMQSSVDGIVATDMKGYITYLNRGMEEMLGYDREELLGRHISYCYVRGIQEARDVMGILRSRERTENYEMEVRRKDGEVLSIMTSAALLRDGEGHVMGTVGVFKDITEQKRLEAKLRETQAHLVESSKMRALGELVAAVAHELNNPIMASQTMLHVIMSDLEGGGPNRDRLEIIRRCNDRIARIVDHLREFSRVSGGEFEELDVNKPIENALLIMGQQLIEHNVSLVKNLSDGLPKVLGDANQLEQVFLNLISNARDALDAVSGPKGLTIASYAVGGDGGQWVVASVKDTGVGIPKELLGKVMEPFFTTKPVGRGTGLGLSLCFKIVEDHGGRLEIDSEPGVGTEVKVLLPVTGSPQGVRDGQADSDS
jgi:PAS domain S-box-containing protein